MTRAVLFAVAVAVWAAVGCAAEQQTQNYYVPMRVAPSEAEQTLQELDALLDLAKQRKSAPPARPAAHGGGSGR